MKLKYLKSIIKIWKTECEGRRTWNSKKKKIQAPLPDQQHLAISGNNNKSKTLILETALEKSPDRSIYFPFNVFFFFAFALPSNAVASRPQSSQRHFCASRRARARAHLTIRRNAAYIIGHLERRCGRTGGTRLALKDAANDVPIVQVPRAAFRGSAFSLLFRVDRFRCVLAFDWSFLNVGHFG